MENKSQNSLLQLFIGLAKDISDPICITSLEATPIFINNAFKEFSEFTTIADFINHGGLTAALDINLKYTIANINLPDKTNWQGEVQFVTKSGRSISSELKIKPLADTHGTILEAILLFKHFSIKKNTEEYLSLLESFVDHANDAVMITEAEPINTPGPRIVYVNPAFTKITGYTKEEMLGVSPRKLQGPKTDRKQLDKIREALIAHQPLKVELINYKKDGQEFWVDFSLVPVTNKTGKVTHFVSIQRETTEKKMVEQALVNSQKDLKKALEATKNIFDRSLDLICTIDRNGKFVQVNKACERTCGYQPEELIGHHFTEFVYPEDREKTLAIARKIVSVKVVNDFENRCIHKDGRIIPMMWSGTWSDESNLIYTIGRDISERKEAENKLKQSEQLYLSVIKNFPNGAISIFDRDYHLVFIEGKGLAHMGLSQEFFIGKSLYELFDAEIADKVIQTIAPTFDGKFISFELPFYGHQLACQTVPLFENDEINRFMVVSQDITSRKEYEEKLQNYTEELEKINSELDQFVYRTSHDLRAPLVSVIGLISLAQTEKDEAQRNEYLNLMLKSINRLDNLIKDIIDYSRSSRIEVKPEQINLTSLVQQTVEDLRYMAEAEAITIDMDIESIHNFYSDRSRLEVVLRNIIANAIRYTDPWKGNQYIHIRIFRGEHSNIQLIIEDNGIGIGKEHLDKVFKMFYRATQINVGSGLGLYIVKENIRKLKGSIQVSSEVGKGTTFYIHIPSLSK